ncbi:MAG: metalloregulator ArsR/SmtB family transcription factor [Candidatus Brocadiia bacterium]
MRRVVRLAKALAEQHRLRALCALRGRELCVCQIVALLELAPSTVSKHMSILHRAGLVESRKTGRWVYYRLAGEDAPPEAAEALGWALKHLSGTRQARRDAERLEEILSTDPEKLCAMRGEG